MSTLSTIGKSQTLAFGVTIADAVDVVVFWGLRFSTTPLEKWAYPARAGYNTLTKLGDKYSGKTTEAATNTANNGELLMELKAWNSTNCNIVKRFVIATLEETNVKSIAKSV